MFGVLSAVLGPIPEGYAGFGEGPEEAYENDPEEDWVKVQAAFDSFGPILARV